MNRQCIRITALASIIMLLIPIFLPIEHADAAPNFDFKKGSFTKSTGVAPASQSITGVGFQPKVVIFFWTRQTTEGTTSGINAGYGFTSGSANERAIAIASDDNVGTSNTGRSESQTRCIIILSNGNPTVTAEAELTSFNSDGFTINWTTNEARADIIHYIALGGSELTNALASSFTATSGSGTQSVTGVGFKPDFLMFLSIDASGTTTSTTGKSNIGFASSSTSEGSLAVTLEEAQAAAYTWVRQRTDNSLNELSDSGADDMLADITSFDSDGFTINKSSADVTAVHFLALKGGVYKVGSFNKSTSGAPASQSVTGIGFKPEGLILTSMNLASNTAIQAEGRISFGASDGTTEGATWFHDKDAADPTDTNQRTSTSKIAVHASQGTLNAEADLTSFDVNGFTLNWTTNNAVAEEIIYVAFGHSPLLYFEVKKGSFAKSTGTAPVSQSVTGVGFQPKAVIFFWTEQIAAGSNVEVMNGYGFTTGPSNERAIAITADDGDGDGDPVGRQSQSRVIIILDPDGTQFRAAAELTSFDADGFTLNWTTNDTIPVIIHYIALGGSDLTNALASSFTATTGAGTQSITGVGFRPDFLMFVSMDKTTMDTTFTDVAQVSIGFASSPTEEAGIGAALTPNGVTTSDTYVRQRTDNSIVEIAGSGGTEDMLADVTSFDIDGFTINKSSSVDATVIHYLALKGGVYKVGSFNKSTGVAPVSQSVTGVSSKPMGLILVSKNLASNTAIEAEGRISFGASDGTTEGATWFHEKDNLGTTDANQRTSTSKVAVHASQTTPTAEADLTSFDTDGFTLNWTTNNAVAEEIIYVAIERAAGKELLESVSTVDRRNNNPTKVLLETISLSDTLAAVSQFIRNLNESLALADTNVRAFSRKLDETLTLSDTLNAGITFKILQETLATSDTLNAATTLKNIQETLGIADAVVKSTVRNIEDTLAIADSLVPTILFTKILNETVSLADSVIAQNSLIKQLSETIGLADSLSTLASNILNLAEALGLQDTFNRILSDLGTTVTATLIDTVTLTHDIPTGTGTPISINFLAGCGVIVGGNVTFPSVSTAGTTSVTPHSTGPAAPPDFTLVGLGGSAQYVDISTTATFTGPAEICLTYADTGLTPEQEDMITIQRFNGAGWEDITTSRDTVANIVYGSTNSFSEFAVMFTQPVSGGGGDIEERRYTIVDTTAPQIMIQEYKPDLPVEGRELIITAKVIDDVGISNAYMLCFFNEENEHEDVNGHEDEHERRFEKFEMKMYSPQWYQGTVPGHDIVRAGMSYTIVVQDAAGNIAQSAMYDVQVQEAKEVEEKPSQKHLPHHVLDAINARAKAKSESELVAKLEVISMNGSTMLESYEDKIIIRNAGNRTVDNIRLILSPELANGFKLSETAVSSIKPNSNVTINFSVIGNPNKDMMGNLVSHDGVLIVVAEHHSPIFMPVSIGSEEKYDLSSHMNEIRSMADERYNKISLLNDILTKHQKTQYKYEVRTSSGDSVIRNPSGELLIRNVGDEPIKNVRLFISSIEYPFHLERNVIGSLEPHAQVSIKLIPKVDVNYSPKDIRGELLIVPSNDKPIQLPIEIAKQNIKIDEFAVGAVLGGDRIFTAADQIIIKNGNRTLDSVRLFLSSDLAKVFMLSNDSFQHIEPNSEVTVDLKFRGIGNDEHVGLQYNYEGELVIVSEHHMQKVIPISIVWNEVSSKDGHFTVYTRNGETETEKANELLSFLESNNNEVVKRFGEMRTKTKIYVANAAEFRILSGSDAQSYYAFTDDLIFVCSCADAEDAKIVAMKEFVYRMIINKYPNYSNKEKFSFDGENWLMDGIANYIAASYDTNLHAYNHTAHNVATNTTAKSIIHQEMIHSQIESFMEKPTSFMWYGKGTGEQYGAAYTFFEYLHNKYGEKVIDRTLYYLGSGMISNTRCDTLEDCAVLRAVYDVSGLDMRKKRYTLDLETLVNEWEEYVRENYDVAIDIVYNH